MIYVANVLQGNECSPAGFYGNLKINHFSITMQDRVKCQDDEVAYLFYYCILYNNEIEIYN